MSRLPSLFQTALSACLCERSENLQVNVNWFHSFVKQKIIKSKMHINHIIISTALLWIPPASSIWDASPPTKSRQNVAIFPTRNLSSTRFFVTSPCPVSLSSSSTSAQDTRFVFECDELSSASPAFLTRCALVALPLCHKGPSAWAWKHRKLECLCFWKRDETGKQCVFAIFPKIFVKHFFRTELATCSLRS